MTNQSGRKRGKLSLHEMQYIRENVRTQSIEDIALHLNRTPAPIKRFIVESTDLVDPNTNNENNLLKQKLYSKSFWGEIKKQFDEASGELQYFEEVWINLVKQFREDVLPAEELQIKQYITIEILINRSMKERKRHIAETEKLQKLIDKEYEKLEEDRDVPKLANMEQQITFSRNSLQNYTTEYTKLLTEAQKISKDLKATREQRIQRIEDGKSSWAGLIRMLEDESLRDREGREMQILKMATDKAKAKMMNYHSYVDNSVDIPLLTPETIVTHEV